MTRLYLAASISVLGKWRDALESRSDILKAQGDSRDDMYFF
jgi:hypothetical protein